jgi:hypothetical protein
MNFRIALTIPVTVVVNACWPATAKQISLDADAWDIRFSYDMPEHPITEWAGWRLTSPEVAPAR